MIPKIIHYCWLSDDPFPPTIQKCINSWKEKMPDYEIKRWSTKNFDIDSVPLVKEAYEAKKYAFAADYIRCYALYTEGGIYLDSDVFVFQNFEKLLDGVEYMTGIEFHPASKKQYRSQVDETGRRKDKVKEVYGIALQAAVMASIRAHPFMKDCLQRYENLSFHNIIENHLLAPIVQVQEMEKYGFRYSNKIQHLEKGIAIYPTSIIGQERNEIKGRYLSHLGAGSWLQKNLKQKIIYWLDGIGLYKKYMWAKSFLNLLSE